MSKIKVSPGVPLQLAASDYRRFGLIILIGILLNVAYMFYILVTGNHCGAIDNSQKTYSCTLQIGAPELAVLIVGSIATEIIAFLVIALRHGLTWLGWRRVTWRGVAIVVGYGGIGIVGIDIVLQLLATTVGGAWNQEQFPGLPLNQAAFGLVFVIFATLIAPVFEETVFRGILLRSLWQKLGFWPAAVLSSLIFGLVHAPAVPGMLGAFLIGLILAYAYRRVGSLVPGMILHGVNNFIGVLLLTLHALHLHPF